MELHSVHESFHHGHLGEEKHQMLNLNRRLEAYLSRVKLLEEENELLAKEIQAMRCSNHRASTWRKGLEEELLQARLEVDAAWRDGVHTEMEVSRLAEQLQALDLQRQREAQAHVQAKMKLEQSRKELEEEQKAQIWLREKVSQLEHEMKHLIQTHQDDVSHLEAAMAHSRATVPPTLAQRGNQTPNLLQLGQEYSQRASRAWQEAAEAYQGQLARLEESLHQTRSRLTRAGQEKSESQLKLRALQKEIASAQDVRLHLEKTAAQQEHRYRQEIQQLQEHLEGLEVEKEEVGRQIDRVLLENQGLQQAKVSLGLEVATYRALLDSESLRGDVCMINQPRHFSITEAVFSPRGVKKNYQTQLSTSHNTTYLSSVRGGTGRGPTSKTTTPSWSRKPVAISETPKVSVKPAYEDTTKSAAWDTPYPKILQDGAVEHFRPQEVHEKVTYAEPLSPPNELEAPAETASEDRGGEDDGSNAAAEAPPEEAAVTESLVSYQVESGLSSEPPFSDEFTTSNLTPRHGRTTEEPCGFSDESDQDVPFKIPAEREEVQEPPAPTDAWAETECKGKEVEDVQEETSDSGTEAVLEANFGSRTSSPASEYEPEESIFSTDVMDFSRDENILKEDAAETKQEMSSSVAATNETDSEDKLYPDGEEMDTWDSVIERKADLKTEDGIKKDEEKRVHAEPEEDISTREHEKGEISQDVGGQRDDNVASSVMDKQVDDVGQQAVFDQQHAPLPVNEEDDEEEDSQNVSVSWRTELESDSYAQDNTLADTRPLIRYKSDETDANTQASHMDESESSEGEQEKKVGETGAGTWSDGKTKRFGTMEDLCEEGEGEALDEEYDLGYAHIEDRAVGHGLTVSEQENAEAMIQKVSEGHSDEEAEEPANVDYNEELETDRLVEEELESLSTDRYSAHFAHRQVGEGEEMLHVQSRSVEEMTEQEEAEETKPEDTSLCVRVDHQLTSSSAVIDQPHEKLYASDSSAVVPQTDTPADEEVQHKDQEAPEKREEEDERSVSTETRADATEDHSGFRDFISKKDVEETSESEEAKSVLQVTADQEILQDVAVPAGVKEVAPAEPQEHLIKDVADCREVHETSEWEVLEEDRGKKEDYEECDNVPEPAESYLHDDDDGGSPEGVTTHAEEPLQTSPDEEDIFVVKDSTQLLNTNDKDNSLHGFFSSGVKNDFWVSSLETGATYQPDDACNEAAEQTNQNLGFADNLVWGDLENPNVVNWNSRLDNDSSKGLGTKKEQEQMHVEVKQVLCRNVVEGESVHSEESEVEGESWSSGEEPV
ncbi:nestin [Chaetodon trifascialis]|uniref:nestin n=1 Tax=Chaetodon trifascialis TaxID=109706 RepID=UPI003991BB01